ncbi:hypothetical protein O6H91_14G030000 [Diphasiastrum complanatum]|uniref:Uncharacterized protein n=1 Tax=Diphasiastrum complanatum TaxID=34168 RepID=A0ACC2BMN9_DIPCM|nr:hypothetical protein O6H91_14G030000 [Diphasiastrum complanatum]
MSVNQAVGSATSSAAASPSLIPSHANTPPPARTLPLPNHPTPPPPGTTASGKRAQSKPGAKAAATPAAPSVKTAEVAPAARRKKRKAPEKQLPDRVAALLPESALYSQLLEFEARVDATLARKKLEIQESVRNPPRYERTLRMYVFNTFANQTQSTDRSSAALDPPSWTLRIMGRILGDDVETESSTGAGSTPGKPSTSSPKFSSFFRRITIQLDPSLYPENHTIVWDAARSTNHVEGFEIKRKGNKEFTVNIRLEMNYSPERFKLSSSLADLLGIEVDTRARIIAALWHYVKGKKLQNPSDPTIINCDPPLRKIFGEDRIKFVAISQKLQHHLSPPQPIHLEHRIKLSGKNPAGNACYDVLVDLPTPLQKEMSAFLANIERHRDIDMYDDLICNAIRKINEHRRRRAFFLGFSHSPVDFINGLIASQSRDLKIVGGQASRNAEKERRSDFYSQPCGQNGDP